MADIDELLIRMNTQLRDTGDKTFSIVEKTEALTGAFEDEYVCGVEEQTLTVVDQRRKYTLDDTIKSVLSVGFDYANDGFPTPLPASATSFVGGSLVIDRSYMNLYAGKKLYLNVMVKYTIDDDLPEFLTSYVLNLGIANCAEYLSNIKINRFLKNDTTMGELLARINRAEQKAQRLRRTLRNRVMVKI